MARAYLAELSLELPLGWEDQSTLTLLGPQTPTGSMLTTKAEPTRPSLVMRRQVVTEHVSLDIFANAQEEMMAKIIPGTRVLEKGKALVGKDRIEALTRDFLLPGGPMGELRQLQFYFFVEGAFFVLVGTAPNDMHFAQHRERFLSLAASLERNP